MTYEPIPGLSVPLIDVGNSAAAAATAAAQQKIIAAQSRAAATDQALLAKNVGLDADFVTSEDNFGAYSHAEIHQHARSLNVEGLRIAHTLWSAESDRLAEVSMSLQIMVFSLMSSGVWQGSSGDAARAAIGALGAATKQIADVFSTVADRLDAAAWAAEATRLAIPPPTTPMAFTRLDPDDPTAMVIPGLVNPATVTVDTEAQTAAENAARAKMAAVYSPAFPTTGDTVPSFVEAPQLGQDGVPSTGSPGNAVAPADQGGSTNAPVTSVDQGGTESPTGETANDPNPATNPAATEEDSEGFSSLSDGASSESGGDGTTPSSATAPSATTPGQLSSTPSPTGNPAASLGGSGAPGSGGIGSLPGIGGSAGVPIAGRPVPDVGAVAGQSRAAAGGPMAAGRAGMPGMGPTMPGAGARGKAGEGSEEHYAPEYLRGVLPDWLTGTEAMPNVFGAGTIAALPVDVAPHSESNNVVPEQHSESQNRGEVESVPAVAPTSDLASVTATELPPAPAELDPQPEASRAPGLSADIASLLAQHGLSSATQSTTPTSESR